MTARITPLSPEEWGDHEHRAIAAMWGIPVEQQPKAGSGHAADPMRFDVLSTMVHHPRLARGFFLFNRTLLFGGLLPERAREIVILRVAMRMRSAYEWGQHVKIGLDVGVTRDEIDAIGAGALDTFSGVEALMLGATDELFDGGRISDATWQGLSGHLDTRQLMELVFCVGAYVTMGMAFETFGLEPEPDTEGLPATTGAPPARLLGSN